MKFSGLDKFSNNLGEAVKALERLDGEIGTVTFDPNDPQSIQMAVDAMEELIDEKMGRFMSNSIVRPMVDSMKAKYSEAIFEKAAGLRSGQEVQ